jgi:NAD(P)-dependent dehydrogenase (short-subunit alcohol dehydrogenase family)
MTAKARRVALVTGAARRIGAGIASRLAAGGIAIVVHASARSEAAARTLVDELRANGAEAQSILGDLSDADEAPAIIGRAAACFGPLDILVNNAAIFEDDTIETLSAERLDRHMAVNLRAPLLLAQFFAAQIDGKSDAAIVNMLDQRVLAPNPLYFSYALSKAALAAATVTLAQALAPAIRVNAVAPGPVLPNAHDGAASFAAEVAAVPLQRAVPIEAVADAVAWLVSARHVTGMTLAVDSGQRLAWETPDVIAARTR